MTGFLLYLNYVIVAVVAIAVLMIFWKHVKPQPPAPPPDVRPASCQQGDHRWRYVAHPYAKQCTIKACGAVVYNSDFVPDGFREYVDFMTHKEDSNGYRPHMTLNERGELAQWVCECNDSTEEHQDKTGKCLRIGCRCTAFRTRTELKLPDWFKVIEVENGPEPYSTIKTV